MSDLQLLFAVLFALYCWECLWWVPRGTVVVRTWLGRRWQVSLPSVLLGNARGGLVWLWPLPPLGTLLASAPLPFSFSVDGFWGRAAASGTTSWRPPQFGRWTGFAGMANPKVSHKRVLAGKAIVFYAPTLSWAARLANLLQEWRGLPPEARERELRKYLAACFDLRRLDRRWTEFQQATKTLRVITNALVIYLFLVAPMVIWRFGLRHVWPGLLLGLFLLTLATALEYRKRHRQLYPRAEEDRFTHCLTILLSPANAARAIDLLSRPLTEDLHPLTLTRKFCSEGEFKRLASECYRDLRFPAVTGDPNPDPNGLRAESHTRQLLLAEVECFLQVAKVELSELLNSPENPDPGCRAYCPRCLAQFVAQDASCIDCGGVKLLPMRPHAH